MNNESLNHLIGLGPLKEWAAIHLTSALRESGIGPRGVLLAGLPGTGKQTVALSLRQMIEGDRPSAELNPDGSQVSIFRVDAVAGEGRESNGASAELVQRPFQIAMSDQPWELSPGSIHADRFDTVWHLDLPNLSERAEFFDRLAVQYGHGYPRFDAVVLARVTHGYSYDDLDCVYRSASRLDFPNPPRARTVLQVVNHHDVLCRAREQQIGRMAKWAQLNAHQAS